LLWLFEAKLGSDRSRASCGKQLRQPDEVVGGRGEGEGGSEAVGAAQHRPSHTADGLHPAEGLFDPLADPLARGIAGMAFRARVHRCGFLLKPARYFDAKPAIVPI